MALIDTYQSLVGTLVALLAAFVGFLGVIYSQRKLSQMAEAGRKHEADLREEEEARATRSQLIALKVHSVAKCQRSVRHSLKRCGSSMLRSK